MKKIRITELGYNVHYITLGFYQHRYNDNIQLLHYLSDRKVYNVDSVSIILALKNFNKTLDLLVNMSYIEYIIEPLQKTIHFSISQNVKLAS